VLEFALLAAGVVLGIALARRRGATRVVAPPRAVGDRPRRRDTTPADVGLVGDETRELATPGARLAELSEGILHDIISQHGATAAAVWRVRDGTLVREMIAGDKGALDSLEPGLEPMLAWSAAEGVVHTGPDGDAPRALVAPFGVSGERPVGALALVFADAVTGDRTQLKAWLARHAERLSVISELVRTHDELAKSNRRTRVLLREAQSWDIEESPENLGARLCGMIEQLTGADGAALVRWDHEEQQGHVAVADGTCARYAGSVVEEDSLAGAACRENVPQIWHEVSGRGEGPEALFSRALPTQTGCVLVQPLRRKSVVLGAVVATHAESGRLGPSELRALSLFDAVASFRLASAWKIEEVTKRALVDGLTGLTNRVGFEAEMRAALAEQMRHQWPVSLVLVDVDTFKDVNDTWGHEAGDEVLRAVSRTLEDGVRTTDVCARVGGDEMALILKDTDGDGARELAERLRAAIAALRIPGFESDVEITASLGVVTYPADVSDWNVLYRMADRALYRAKAQGRNTVQGAVADG
jgi:diguanylate cyclase (GGDEF)-like protein